MFARCREVQASPDGHLDLWAREHYKSTIITYAKTIQDILADPELTVGIFSHTRPIAKGFLRQIMREFEANESLKHWFGDVLWANPRKEAPKWSEDDGIVVRRKSNPKESTVEAWGLVDGQPTSKHFSLMVYDDVVTRESVNTADQIAKTTDAWALSRNLGAKGGRSRYIGTRYDFADTYRAMMDRRAVQVRTYAATTDGTAEGRPVHLTPEEIEEKRREMGPYIFACQMLQDPVADSNQGFSREWVRHYKSDQNGAGMNVYILCDAASEKKKDSDYTCIWVWGFGRDQNMYVLDILRDRMNLTERASALMEMHRKWNPLRVGYERYGMMADIEYIKTVQERENYRFDIVELGGPMPKRDRIKRLIPDMEQGRVYLPQTLMRTDYQKRVHDLVKDFIEEEMIAFPFGLHDDMLDAASRIYDDAMARSFPMEAVNHDTIMESSAGWMSG